MTHLTHAHKVAVLIAAAALIVLTLGGLTWLLLGPSDSDPIAETPVVTSAPDTTTTTAPTPAYADDEQMRGDGGEGDWHQGEGLPLPPMGMPSITLDWEQIQLPSRATGEGWMDQLFEVNDRLYITGGFWDEQVEEETLFMFESEDGITWTELELPAELLAAGVGGINPAGDYLVGFAHEWSDEMGAPSVSVHLSPDARSWTEADTSGFANADERLWLWQAAGVGETIVLAGNLEPFMSDQAHAPQPIIIHKDGLTVEIDPMTRSFLITDDASGEVVLHGSEELIWDYEREDEGTALYDPQTGEPVFTIRWETLNDLAETLYRTAPFDGDLVLEYSRDGRTMTFDQFTRAVVVTEDSTGDIVFSGTESDLWQGKPPMFVDPSTDTVVLRLTWDEWNEAHEASYPEEPEMEYWNRSVVLTSTDGGSTFTPVDLTSVAGDGFHLSAMTGGPDGFVAFGGMEGPWLYEHGAATDPEYVILSSPDGLSWQMADSDLDAWVHEVVAVDNGYLAIMAGEAGATVFRSADGSSWTTFLDRSDLQLPFGVAWFDRVTATEAGTTFVVGSRDGWEHSDIEAVTFTKQGRTLTIEGPEYTLVDDATGTVLLSFNEQDYWGEHEGPYLDDVTPPVRWGEGGMSIFTDDGTLLFALSHEEQWEVEREGEPEEWYEPEQILLRNDGTGWVSIELPDAVGPYTWFSGLVAGDGAVILAANVEDSTSAEWSQTLEVFIGRGGAA